MRRVKPGPHDSVPSLTSFQVADSTAVTTVARGAGGKAGQGLHDRSARTGSSPPERNDAEKRSPTPLTTHGTLPAFALDAFRIIAGCFLCAYEFRNADVIPQMIADGVVQASIPRVPTLFMAMAQWLESSGPSCIRATLLLGAMLGCLIALGLAPRLCAALLLSIFAATFHLVQPAVTFGDYVGEAASFALCLLPVGQTLRLVRGSPRRALTTVRASGWGPAAALAFAGVCLARLWLLGLVPLSAALCIVVAIAGAGSACLRHMNAKNSIELGATVHGAAAALLAVQALASQLGVQSIVESSGAVLANVGLPWSWEAPMQTPPPSALELAFVAEGSGRLDAGRVAPGNARVQLLLHALERASSSHADPALYAVVRHLVAHHCRATAADSSEAKVERLVLVHDGKVVNDVVRFECQEQTGTPRMLPFGSDRY
jgi:hypothetical protein